MLTRRFLTAAIPVVLSTPAWAVDSFQGFLAGVRAEAQRTGVSVATLDRALNGLRPNQQVLEHYNHQPEFTLTWAQYRKLVVTDQRAEAGRAALHRNAGIIDAVERRYGVATGVTLGIWGLEFELRSEDRRLQRGASAGDVGVADQAGSVLPIRADRRAAHPERR